MSSVSLRAIIIAAALGTAFWSGAASAEPFALTAPGVRAGALFDQPFREPEASQAPGDSAELPPHLGRQIVNYDTRESAGTIIVDTPNTYLYYVLGNGRAIRYGIGVGRDGFRWSGVEAVTRMAEWPDWYPPAEMISRQPYLPRFMAGGESNPLGARALYLGNSAYRIHGTNAPTTIGQRVSSGCIRMTNDDVIDLYKRVRPGTKVVVLPDRGRHQAGTARASASARDIAQAEALQTRSAPQAQPVAARAEPAQPMNLAPARLTGSSRLF